MAARPQHVHAAKFLDQLFSSQKTLYVVKLQLQAGSYIVSVPDPKPTPAQIAFSIARYTGIKRYMCRMKSGDGTIVATMINFQPEVSYMPQLIMARESSVQEH